MAWFVNHPQIVIFFSDGRSRGRFTTHAPGSYSYDQINAYTAALAAAMRGVSGAQISEYEITIHGYDAAAIGPDIGAWNGHAGVFLFETEESEIRFVYVAPSFLDSKLLDGVTIDTTDPAVAALIQLLTVGDGTVEPSDSEGNGLTEVLTAYLQDRPCLDYYRKG